MNHVKRVAIPAYDDSLFDACKWHTKITSNSEDGLLRLYLEGVINACENKLQTAILNTNFELYAPHFCQHIDLQKKFVSAVNSVKYYDEDGVQQTVNPANYSLQDFKEPNVLYFNDDYEFPSLDVTEFPVIVNYNAGFVSASSIIPNIRNAIFLEFADRYENRQNEIIGERVQSVIFNVTADKMLNEECLFL